MEFMQSWLGLKRGSVVYMLNMLILSRETEFEIGAGYLLVR